MTHLIVKGILTAAFAFAGILQVVAIVRDPVIRIDDVSWSGKPMRHVQVSSTTFIATGVLIASVASIVALSCI